MESYSDTPPPGNAQATRIGDHWRLPCYEFGTLAAVCYWPDCNPGQWTTGGLHAILGIEGWALPADEGEPLAVSRHPADWLRRQHSVCILSHNARQIGVYLRGAGRPLSFENRADAAWGYRLCRACSRAPMPLILVEDQEIARAA